MTAAEAPQAVQQALARLRDPELLAEITAELNGLSGAGKGSLALVAGAERLSGGRRVGVLSGSFNPPTLAHLALAQAALEQGGVDVVLLSISQVTLDKERVTRAPLLSRLAALTALADRWPALAVGVLGAGLYADQARALHANLPDLADLAFIMGFDKIVQIVDPHYYQDFDAALRDLFSHARLLVAPRAGEGRVDLAALLAQPENRPYAASVQYLPLDPIYQNITSTDLRTHILRGASIVDLAPPEAQALVLAGAYA